MNNEQMVMRLEKGKWVPVLIQELKENDLFRIFDENGNPFTKNGAMYFTATADAEVDLETEKVTVRSIPTEI